MKKFNSLKEIKSEIIIYKNMLKQHKPNSSKYIEINKELDSLHKLKLGLKVMLKNKTPVESKQNPSLKQNLLNELYEERKHHSDLIGINKRIKEIKESKMR